MNSGRPAIPEKKEHIAGEVAVSACTPCISSNWYFVTNQTNYHFMLATGMILPRAGYGEKYYRDMADLVDGCILLFKECPPAESLKYAIGETKWLLPCILTIDLKSYVGPLLAYSEGDWVELFCQDDCSNISFIVVQAPLPMSLVLDVKIKNADQRKSCEQKARELSNVPIDQIPLTVKNTAKLFKGSKEALPSDLPSVKALRAIDLNRANSMAGAMAALNLLSNTSSLVEQARNCLSPLLSFQDGEEKELTSFRLWCQTGNIPSISTMTGKHFLEILDDLIAHRSNREFETSKDIVLMTLRKSAEKLPENSRPRVLQLIGDLTKLVQFPDLSVDENLDNHSQPLSRALIVFFAYDSLAEFIDFGSKKLSGMDLVYAVTLYGTSSGLQAMPVEFKTYAAIFRPMTAAMANYAFQVNPDNQQSVSVVQCDDFPMSIRQQLDFNDKAWNRRLKDAALQLALLSGWNCVNTDITLPVGEYSLGVSGKNVVISTKGDRAKIETRVNRADIIHNIENGGMLPFEIEAKVRNLLGS